MRAVRVFTISLIRMKSDEQLLHELEQLTAGLLFMSESDYPFTAFLWNGSVDITEDYLREIAGEKRDAPVSVVSVDKFFRVAASEPEWKGAEELAVAKRYQALLKWLKENLYGLKVYRIGEISIPVYIVGKSASGSWIGILTRVVET